MYVIGWAVLAAALILAAFGPLLAFVLWSLGHAPHNDPAAKLNEFAGAYGNSPAE